MQKNSFSIPLEKKAGPLVDVPYTELGSLDSVTQVLGSIAGICGDRISLYKFNPGTNEFVRSNQVQIRDVGDTHYASSYPANLDANPPNAEGLCDLNHETAVTSLEGRAFYLPINDRQGKPKAVLVIEKVLHQQENGPPLLYDKQTPVSPNEIFGEEDVPRKKLAMYIAQKFSSVLLCDAVGMNQLKRELEGDPALVNHSKSHKRRTGRNNASLARTNLVHTTTDLMLMQFYGADSEMSRHVQRVGDIYELTLRAFNDEVRAHGKHAAAPILAEHGNDHSIMSEQDIAWHKGEMIRHDFGKSANPRNECLWDGKEKTPAQKLRSRQHPILSCIIMNLPYFSESTLPLSLHHPERFDDPWYKGIDKNFSIYSAAATLCDKFEAMTGERVQEQSKAHTNTVTGTITNLYYRIFMQYPEQSKTGIIKRISPTMATVFRVMLEQNVFENYAKKQDHIKRVPIDAPKEGYSYEHETLENFCSNPEFDKGDGIAPALRDLNLTEKSTYTEVKAALIARLKEIERSPVVEEQPVQGLQPHSAAIAQAAQRNSGGNSQSGWVVP